MRVGIGYDVHKLAHDRELIIGGVKIPFEKGLLGHSDADVLLHAIMDALLGAAAMGDIGFHFPDSDPLYEGASSIELLKQVGQMLRRRGYHIINIDSIIIAQKPKLRNEHNYMEEMQNNISNALGLDPLMSLVNVKATTEEGLGFTGDGSGIAAKAVCFISNEQK